MSRAPGRAALRRRLRAVGALRRRGAARGRGQDWAAALGATLGELGPLPAAFARYLALRPDVLPLVCCEELAAAPSSPSPPPADEVRRGIETALGMPLRQAFGQLASIAVAGDPLRQWHRASLLSGRAVLVEVDRPDVAAAFDEGIELLSEIAGLLAVEERAPPLPWRRLLDDFTAWVSARRDLEARRELWRKLESDALLRDAWAVPVLVDELSRGCVLVVEEPRGSFLPRALAEDVTSPAAADLARRAVLAWLELAAFGGFVLEGVEAGDVFVLDDGRLLLLGGGPRAVGEEEVAPSLDSVAATALGHPDAACRSLLALADAPDRAEASSRLLVRLRQASPIRDGGLGRRYRGVRLAESLFVAWRLLRRSGFEPRPALRWFATGVASLESHTRSLAATDPARARDPFAEAVADLQVMRGAEALRRAFGPVAWRERLEQALPLVSELPERVDAWLERPSSPPRAAGRRPETRARWAALGVVLALLAVVVASAARLGSSPPWIEHAAAGLSTLLGAGAVWVAWGGRSTIHRR